MHIIKTLDALADQRAAASGRLGFVPTMGNLHAGHIDLVHRARAEAERVAVSIFVNPMQFGAGEDFDSYPRTEQADLDKLAAAGVDWVFLPSPEMIYPNGAERHTRVEVPGLSDVLCGASRPGHFAGVATVVTKLLNLVACDVAVFGEKDFQQLRIIQTLVADLALPVRIVAAPTVREPDGLAMSSRNRYLNADQRARAPKLYAALTAAAEQIRAGDPDTAAITALAAERLRREGFKPEYLALHRQDDLGAAGPGDSELILLAAAQLGAARLIDNLKI